MATARTAAEAVREALSPPPTSRVTWLIARRAALESLRDRATLWTSLFFALVLPTLLVVVAVRPQAAQAHGAEKEAALGTALAVYLLVVGLMPSSGSVSVAAGVFAGEKEQGNLAPLLATPASNNAIFGGKVLGAVLPALLYAVIAEVTYLLEVALVAGPRRLGLLPPALSLGMVALVPAMAVLGAAVASLISSRARTYTGAQMVTSLALLPVMGGLFGLAFKLPQWGAWAVAATVAALVALDLALVAVGAATWRREEVMARR